MTTDEWFTPPHVIRRVRAAFGGVIDLDPASNGFANGTVQARMFYTQEDDGLVKPWHGRVWLNPPFSATEAWVRRALLAFDQDEIEEAIVLTNANTETKWGQLLLSAGSVVCFPRRRIRFIPPDGAVAGHPTKGQMLTHFGKDISRFVDAFGGFGAVLPLQRARRRLDL